VLTDDIANRGNTVLIAAVIAAVHSDALVFSAEGRQNDSLNQSGTSASKIRFNSPRSSIDAD
jgi:hypothetical protein